MQAGQLQRLVRPKPSWDTRTLEVLTVFKDPTDPDGFRVVGNLLGRINLDADVSESVGDPGASRTVADFTIELPFAA